VRRERELERGDVPARSSVNEEAGAVAVPGVAAERAAGPRADDAVDGEAAAVLEAPYGGNRPRAADAVDRPRVEPASLECDLQSGDARAPESSGRDDQGEKNDGCGGEGSWRHNPERDAWPRRASNS
jgi:hypothetical protein